MRASRVVAVASLVLVTSSACGVGLGASDPARVAPPAAVADAPESSGLAMRIYLTTAQGPWPVWRRREPGADVQTSMDLLLDGPTRSERARGVTSAIPRSYGALVATAGNGRVDVDLPSTFMQTDTRIIDQIACTAASAPGVGGGLPANQVIVSLHEPDDPEGVQLVCDAGVVDIATDPSDRTTTKGDR